MQGKISQSTSLIANQILVVNQVIDLIRINLGWGDKRADNFKNRLIIFRFGELGGLRSFEGERRTISTH